MAKSSSASARSKAEDQFARAKQRDDDYNHQRDKAEKAEVAKRNRLKNLRLAKEEEDRVTAEKAAAEKAAAKANKKPVKRERRKTAEKAAEA